MNVPDTEPEFTIPESWPLPAAIRDERIPIQVPWFTAPMVAILATIFPRRLGSHLAASSWLSAYLAHAFSLLVVAGVFASDMVARVSRPWSGATTAVSRSYADSLIEPFAALYLAIYSTTLSWLPIAIIGGVLVVVEAGIWCGASALVVFLSDGERSRRIWLRTAKLLLWSTLALVVPIAASLWIGALVRQDWARFGSLRTMISPVLLLGTAWWLTVVLRLGSRCRIAPDADSQSPRDPRCEACGYILTGLSSLGCCPECGRAVVNSLPQYRCLPAFARAQTPAQRCAAYLLTTIAALRTRAFGERLAVNAGLGVARQFALLTCVGVGVLLALGSSHYWIEHYGLRAGFIWILTAGLAAGLSAFVSVALLGTILVLGRRDVLRRSIVVCYSSAWLYPSTALGIAGFWVARWVYHSISGRGLAVLPLLGPVDRELLRIAIAALFFAPALIDLSHLFRRTIRLLNATRYANG